MKIESLKLWCESEFVLKYHTKDYGYVGKATGFFLEDKVEVDKDFEHDKEFLELVMFLKGQRGEYLFHSQVSLLNYCKTKTFAHVPYQFGSECFGFRVIGETLAWYIFVTPWNDKNVFFIHVFLRDVLFSTLAKERNLVKSCHSIYPFTGERVEIFYGIGVVKYPQYGSNFSENQRYATEINRANKISIEVQKALEYGAIYGWEKPLARAESYDKNGKIKVD